MTKSTMGTKLPRKLEQKMQIVGEQIRLARLRRNLSVAQIAERATCSPLTVSRIEKGAPTVCLLYTSIPLDISLGNIGNSIFGFPRHCEVPDGNIFYKISVLIQRT